MKIEYQSNSATISEWKLATSDKICKKFEPNRMKDSKNRKVKEKNIFAIITRFYPKRIDKIVNSLSDWNKNLSLETVISALYFF